MSSRATERLEADVAVVGAGPAGIAAAVTAARGGGQVLLLDEGIRPGGRVWQSGGEVHLPATARLWLERLEESGARLIRGAAVVDAEAGGRLLADVRGRALRVQAPRVILATGARERFVPFPGWTLPGVMGVGGAQALLASGLRLAGRRVVVAGSGPLLLPVAAAMLAAGADLRLVAEQAPGGRVLAFARAIWRSPSRISAAARYRLRFRRVPYRTGCWVTRADGDGVVQEVTLTNGWRTWRERCDVLAAGYGLVPAMEMARLLGCEVENGRVVVDDEQRTTVAGVWCAGEPTGVAGAVAAVAEGEIAGASAAGVAIPGRAHRVRRRELRLARAMEVAFALRPELRIVPDGETVVCRCEDVRLAELRPEWDARHAKLVTRAGMGACQGRVCGPALEILFGWEQPAVRPPILPVPIATLIEGGEGVAEVRGGGAGSPPPSG
jgi:D-hydroxyproline dehydrogenase subunit alpha